MGYKRKTVLLIISLLFLMCGCITLKQPSNKVVYYYLEYESPEFTGLDQLPHGIRIESFTVAPTYNTSQIIYREQSFERDAYAYYKWRVNPGSLVTQFLTRDIRDSGLFKAVIPCDSRFEASFIMEGMVEEFFELDESENWNAVLSLSIILAEEDIDNGSVFQKSYSTIEPCEKRHPRALAAAMSLAMKRLSKEIIEDIHNCLVNYQ